MTTALRDEPKYFGPFCFDAQNFRLRRGKHSEHLPPRACEVLTILVNNAGNVVDKRELEGVDYGGSAVYQISFLRNKVLAKFGAKYKKYIETVSRTGYRFVPELKA